MRTEDIIEFVKKNVEPLPAYPPYGERYRVAAIMSDGTPLPCVVIEGASIIVDLALKRFEETRNSPDPYMGYRAIVKSFVTKGNTINDYDLKELTFSPHAIPLSRMQEIKGETSMGWTEFYAEMKDGTEFRFGTTFLTEFFDMPSGYSAADIVKIALAARGEKPRQEHIYREKSFFTCYVEGL
jgi:hypothetical protein